MKAEVPDGRGPEGTERAQPPLTVAAVTFGGSFRRTVDGNRRLGVERARQAAEMGAKLICLPEAFTAKWVALKSVRDVAEEVPGPTTEALATIASQHSCIVVCPIYTWRQGVYWNSAVILGPDGQIAGIYDKAHPCTSNDRLTVFEHGVTPGTRPGTFDLGVGRFGIRICADAWYPSSWTCLAEHGVRAVLWPSAYDGGRLPNSHAVLHQYFIVCAVRDGRARIIDPCGSEVAETAPGEAIAIADVSLDFLVVREEQSPRLTDVVERRYGDLVDVRRYPEEGLFLLQPRDGGPGRAELQSELGVVSAARFAAAHLEAYASAG